MPLKSPGSVKPSCQTTGKLRLETVSASLQPNLLIKECSAMRLSRLLRALSNCTPKTSSFVSRDIPQLDCLHGKKFLLLNVSCLLSSCSGSYCCKVSGSLISSCQYQPLRYWRRLKNPGGCRLISHTGTWDN